MDDHKRKLPVGIENFEEIRTEGFYYIDKTGLITDLLQNWGKVNLFTRPRRFGKSLNISMLKTFSKLAVSMRYLTDWKFRRKQSCVKNIWGSFR